jgi:hypothetical protein
VVVCGVRMGNVSLSHAQMPGIGGATSGDAEPRAIHLASLEACVLVGYRTPGVPRQPCPMMHHRPEDEKVDWSQELPIEEAGHPFRAKRADLDEFVVVVPIGEPSFPGEPLVAA